MIPSTSTEDMDRLARSRHEEACDAEEQRIKAASAELRECPFCGSPETEISLNRDDEYVGFCGNCHAQGPPCEYLDNAVSGWNHREAAAAKPAPKAPERPRLDLLKNAA